MIPAIPHERRLRNPARALLVVDQPVLAEIIVVALSQGPYNTRVARTIDEANAALTEWPPHVAVLDMDIKSSAILDRLRPTQQAGSTPVIAPTATISRRSRPSIEARTTS